MPKKYQVHLSDGRTVVVEADAPPSEADILSALPQKADGKSLGGFLENIGTSASNAVSGLANAVLHPIDTMNAADAGKRQFEDASRQQIDQFKAMTPAQQRDEVSPRLSNVTSKVADLGNEAYRNPVGVALDVAGALPAGAIGGAVERATSAVGRKVADFAPRLVQSAIKPTVSELRRQSGASVNGLQGQADRVSQVMLRTRFTKPEQAVSAVQKAEGDLQRVIAAAPDGTTLDTATRVPRYLKKLESSAAQQAIPGQDVTAIRSAHDAVLNGPLAESVTRTVDAKPPAMGQVQQSVRQMRTDVTPSEGLDIARATGRWGNRKQWGELKGAEQEASKATERAVRDSFKEALPDSKAPLQAQRDALTALPILDRMKLRQGNRDVVGLPAWVAMAPAAATGNLGAAGILGGLAQGARNLQLPMGYAAADAGQAVMGNAGRVGQASEAALRAAILAQLLGQQPPQ